MNFVDRWVFIFRLIPAGVGVISSMLDCWDFSSFKRFNGEFELCLFLFHNFVEILILK